MHADDADADRRVVELVVVTIANPHLWPNSETMIMMTHTRGADDDDALINTNKEVGRAREHLIFAPARARDATFQTTHAFRVSFPPPPSFSPLPRAAPRSSRIRHSFYVLKHHHLSVGQREVFVEGKHFPVRGLAEIFCALGVVG